MNASFAAATPVAGQIAFISQSGALCTAVLDWAMEKHIGFSHFVSMGNMLDVNFADLIDYFGQSPSTRAILLYIESMTDARQFMSAARAFARNKPIIAYKAGRFAESAAAAASHTGAMAGEDSVYDAAFERAGIERVFEIDDMFECAGLLARHRIPRGGRLAIVTNAGGPGVMATDALMDHRGELARITEPTIAALNEVLPASWSHANPIDILGDALDERYADATRIVLGDPNVDAALVILTPQAMTDPVACAKSVAEIAQKANKPVLTAWMGGATVRPGINILDRAGIPTFNTPEAAIHAFMHLASYARNLDTLYETPREVPLFFELQLRQKRSSSDTLLDHPGGLLSEIEAKQLLHAYDIHTTMPHACVTADDAAGEAQRIGYPVVAKIHSPQITHKTDVGGVMINLRDEAEVRDAFNQIVESARQARPDATIEGVTIQPMFKAPNSVELILGAKMDPTFGSVIMLGAGGITAELYKDRVLALPPLNERLARRMVESLKSWPLMRGYRGRPGIDVEKLIETLIRFSYLIADHPRITELDVNPLIATPDKLIAVDARIVVDPKPARADGRPYSHLAIRPYPEHVVRPVRLKDGTPVVLRAIKPEDEPMWHGLLESCSAESIQMRFFSLIREFTHDMATRYCCIDYDREIAIVAEVETEPGERQLVGVGRLVTDPQHESAEYAVIVADAWQGKGLGLLLTDYCLEIAKEWNIRRVTAATLPHNQRMLRTFRNYDFTTQHNREEGVVTATLEL
jgi:acetyltransferase